MENILEYRHFVDETTKRIFMESLKEAVDRFKPKKLGFIGVGGSIKEKHSHDIDLIIFPTENAKIGEAILEIVSLYKEIDQILKKKHQRYYFVPCPKKTSQELVHYLAALEEGSAGLIPVHSLFFTDYESFKRLNPASFIRAIITQKLVVTIYGDLNIIKKLKSLPPKKLEPYFCIIDFEMNARIKNFPRHLIRASAESLFGYLENKYGIKTKNKKIHDIEKIEEEFLRLLKKIDERNYS